MTPLYLDHNATAPLRSEAKAAMIAALDHVGNPSSVHRFGRDARRIVEDAREAVAALIGAPAAGIVFTAGATEANNAILSRCDRSRTLISAVEHDSVLAVPDDAETLAVGPDGLLDPATLDAALTVGEGPALVSVMLANNEIGTIQPIAELAGIARRHGALFHCDAAQAVGKIQVDMAALGVDYLTLSAHKFGGPQGVGALVVREGVAAPRLLKGGGQERRRRAGTENVAGIAGLGAASAAAVAELDGFAALARLRDAMESRIRAACPLVRIFGEGAPRLPNTSCLTMPGVPAETQIMGFDLAGIAVSSGSACSSGKVAASHVLAALGVDRAEAETALRVSLGWTTRPGDIERFVEAWITLRQRAARRSSAAA